MNASLSHWRKHVNCRECILHLPAITDENFTTSADSSPRHLSAVSQSTMVGDTTHRQCGLWLLAQCTLLELQSCLMWRTRLFILSRPVEFRDVQIHRFTCRVQMHCRMKKHFPDIIIPEQSAYQNFLSSHFCNNILGFAMDRIHYVHTHRELFAARATTMAGTGETAKESIHSG